MRNSKKMAMCGVGTALSVTILVFGNIFPLATYVCPAFAACILLPISYEFKERTAFTMYFSVSVLSLFLVLDKELVLVYILIFGLYTVFKFKIEQIKLKFLKIFIKFIYPTVTLSICYLLLLLVFPNPILLGEFNSMGALFILLFFALFVFTFLIYDFALAKFFLIYKYKIRNKIIK